MSDQPVPAGEKQEIPRNPDGTYPPGTSGNPAGRVKGSKSFSTLFQEAVKKIAATNDLDPESIEVDLVQMAIKMAKEGNYSYFKDLMDRNFGQARQKIDHGLDEEITEVNFNVHRGEKK